MKVLLIDRNKFKRTMEVKDNGISKLHTLDADMLNTSMNLEETFETPLDERTENRKFVKKGTTIINGKRVPVFVEEGFIS